MLPYVIQGLVLGATAAAQPGAFQAFLLSLLARDGWRRALPAVLAPLISDRPIVVLVLLVLTRLPEQFPVGATDGGRAVPAVSGVGGVAGVAGREPQRRRDAPPPGSALRAVLKASLMNFLSPGPYIFWATVAGPILIAGWRASPTLGLSFLLGFYVALIGGMALFILVFAGLTGRIDPRLNRALGLVSAVALFAFGLYQLTTGLRALMVYPQIGPIEQI